MDALVIGVNGLVGRAVATALAGSGWTVTGMGRSDSRFPQHLAELGVRFVEGDRTEPLDLSRAVGAGADLVVDCVCFTAEQSRQLLVHAGIIGSAIVISSKAVYVDLYGNHGNSDTRPRFDGPVRENDPVMAPDWSGDYDSREGYGANKVAAETVLLDADWPVTILRPSRIHGVGGARPREWFFVRRLLDGRTRVPLVRRGRTANNPTAASNLAALTVACAASPTTRVLNVADPDAPNAAAIAHAVSAACDRPLQVLGLPDDAPAEFGRTPWASWPPFLLDLTAAAQIVGYAPQPYPVAVRAAIGWLLSLDAVERARLDVDPYFADLFDYDLDDRALALADRYGAAGFP